MIRSGQYRKYIHYRRWIKFLVSIAVSIFILQHNHLIPHYPIQDTTILNQTPLIETSNPEVQAWKTSCMKIEVFCFQSTGDIDKDDDYGISKVREMIRDMDSVYGYSNIPFYYIAIPSESWEQIIPSIQYRQSRIDGTS